MTRPRPVDGENSNQPQISYQEKSFLGEWMRQMTRVISDKIVWWFVNILWFVHEKESPLKSKDNKKIVKRLIIFKNLSYLVLNFKQIINPTSKKIQINEKKVVNS